MIGCVDFTSTVVQAYNIQLDLRKFARTIRPRQIQMEHRRLAKKVRKTSQSVMSQDQLRSPVQRVIDAAVEGRGMPEMP